MRAVDRRPSMGEELHQAAPLASASRVELPVGGNEPVKYQTRVRLPREYLVNSREREVAESLRTATRQPLLTAIPCVYARHVFSGSRFRESTSQGSPTGGEYLRRELVMRIGVILAAGLIAASLLGAVARAQESGPYKVMRIQLTGG